MRNQYEKYGDYVMGTFTEIYYWISDSLSENYKTTLMYPHNSRGCHLIEAAS